MKPLLSLLLAVTKNEDGGWTITFKP